MKLSNSLCVERISRTCLEYTQSRNFIKSIFCELIENKLQSNRNVFFSIKFMLLMKSMVIRVNRLKRYSTYAMIHNTDAVKFNLIFQFLVTSVLLY